jgi:hypothetical protein
MLNNEIDRGEESIRKNEKKYQVNQINPSNLRSG